MIVTVLSHKSLPSTYGPNSEYKRWGFRLLVDDDDEPVQIAIGEYMEKHNIDPGKIHR